MSGFNKNRLVDLKKVLTREPCFVNVEGWYGRLEDCSEEVGSSACGSPGTVLSRKGNKSDLMAYRALRLRAGTQRQYFSCARALRPREPACPSGRISLGCAYGGTYRCGLLAATTPPRNLSLPLPSSIRPTQGPSRHCRTTSRSHKLEEGSSTATVHRRGSGPGCPLGLARGDMVAIWTEKERRQIVETIKSVAISNCYWRARRDYNS